MCGESHAYADGNINTQRQRNTYVNHNTQAKHNAQNYSNSAPDSASIRPVFNGPFFGGSRSLASPRNTYSSWGDHPWGGQLIEC